MKRQKSAIEKTDTTLVKFLFGKKYEDEGKASRFLRQPRFWGALMGELIGTMLLTVAFMASIGVFRADLVPLFLFGMVVAIYVVIYNLSGAHLNPLVTMGAIATRRMPVLRGVFYMATQFAGAWLGLLILTLFKNGGGDLLDVPVELIEVSSETFWAVTLIELMGAMILGFVFARSSRLGCGKGRGGLMYASVMASCIVFLFLLGLIVSQSYYGLYANLVFNPASASAYPIFSNITDGTAQVILTVLAYLVVPMFGGIIGVFLSDVATWLADGGYTCDDID